MPQKSIAEKNHCSSGLELTMRFVIWSQQLGRVPLPEEISEHFHVSYQQSYRWRIAWCDATGIPVPAPRQKRTDPIARHQARRQSATLQTPIQGP